MISSSMSLRCNAQTPHHRRLFAAMSSSRSTISCYLRCSNVGNSSTNSIQCIQLPSTPDPRRVWSGHQFISASRIESVPVILDEVWQIELKKGVKTLSFFAALGLGCAASLVSLQNLRSIMGTFGNILSFLLYTVPLLTFQRIIKNKTTEDFSVIPYIAALLNSVLYALYGSPLVSNGWENVHVFTINSLGVVMETIFISIYFWLASPKKKTKVIRIMAPVVSFCLAMVIMALSLPDRSLRRTILGSFGFFASASMYGSPLVAAKQVIETKSVEFMPLNLSVFSFLTSSVWLMYGLLGKDVLLASPNFIGVPLSMLQLLVYFIYRNNKGLADRGSPLVITNGV